MASIATIVNFVLFAVGILLVVFTASVISSPQNSDCICQHAKSDFNSTIPDVVYKECRKCYVFTYDFTLDQDWAPNLCVNSSSASEHTPLLIVVREYLSVMSFQVPQIFDDRFKSSFSDVCHTLCPLANYFDKNLNASKQNIFVEISSQSVKPVDFAVTLSTVNHFVIVKEKPLTVNITPSQPQVIEYNMEDDLRAVRIEATSSDESCMILAIQNIQCPFSDSERSIEHEGFYQTLMKQSGIAISKKTFPMGRLYIVLLLKITNDDCIELNHNQINPVPSLSKQVTVRIVPAITDVQYYEAVFGALGFYVLIYIFTFVICLYLKTRNLTEMETFGIESPSIQNYGTSLNSEEPEYSSDTVTHSFQSISGQISSISIDEPDMDTLPDASVDKNVVRTKTIVYVSDLSRKNEKILSKRSKIYSWNLFTIAIFYGLPVVQLVYINQRIVNMTGNQDLCYYNFLCSHQVWVFSDFNHVYSNLGYVMLGILFLLIVWRRESLCKDVVSVNLSKNERERNRKEKEEATGIPEHFGLLYAMGLALIIEGVLSGCYHVCPNKSNFQFDTAFMYVIAVVCMLKLYQARHPDITVESHTTWMVLAVVIFIGVGGVLKGGLVYWIIFVFTHLVTTILVSIKIYYMGCVKFNKGLFKRAYQNIQQDLGAKSYSPQYKERFFILSIAAIVNISLDIYALMKQPQDFASYILAVFILNLSMYLFYYIFMKKKSGERIGWIPTMYMCLSFLCWGAAGYFFLTHNTSWKVTPAESREQNRHCIILKFFDHHDIWHFVSSCALFFFFMVLFTLDDDLDNVPRSKIIVF